MNNKNKAILLMLTAALGFALMSVFVKLSGDLPSVQKSFFRNFISLIVATYILVKSGAPFMGNKGNRKFLLGRAFCGTLGILANFYSIDHLILSDANMLNKLSPFFVIIFSYLFLKEKLNKIEGGALILAFAGSLFIIKPSFGVDMFPALIAISSAVFAGAAYTFVRYLGGKEAAPTIVFTFSAFSCLFTLPMVILDFAPMTFEQTTYLLLAGVFASISQFSLTVAYKYAPGKEVSIYDYTQIIFAAILGFIVFNQVPDLFSFIGYALIIGPGIAMFIYNNKKTSAI